MEPEGRYTIIGSLVLLLAAVTIFALVWLSGYSRISQRYYTIYFERQSLRGLQVGGDVNIRGLRVGQVINYKISPSNVNRVKVNIRLDEESPVSVNTAAIISRNLVTGVARVDLETANPPGDVLTAVNPGETYPVIQEGSSEFDVFSDAFNRIAITGEEALRNLNGLLNQENREAFNQTVASLRDLMTGLSGRLDTLDTAGRDLTRTAEALQQSGDRIAAAVEQTTGTVNRSLKPLVADVGMTMRDLRSLFDQARKTVADLGVATGRLEQSSSRAVVKAAEAADVGLLELRSTARELRTAVDGLGRTLDKLSDPRAALLGPAEAQLGPGERR
jgi:phospholipid/cholesterol/gamma-HCH transport system substrate-binding protein